jgi:hypothetical protein
MSTEQGHSWDMNEKDKNDTQHIIINGDTGEETKIYVLFPGSSQGEVS